MAVNQQAVNQQAVNQRTLGAIATATGVGLHLGQHTRVRLIPAEPGAGRYFVRTDLPQAQPIAAVVTNVVKNPAFY